MIFLHPLILLALLVLPLVYWITRITPPPSKQRIFPPLAVLKSIRLRRTTPARASIWLLVTRLAALSLITLGIAHPIGSPKTSQNTLGNGDLTVIIDNGWAAHANRTSIRDIVLRLGKNCFTQGNALTLIATARQEDGKFTGPMVSHDLALLKEHLQRVQPRNWSTERAKAVEGVALKGHKILLIADGVATPEDARFRAELQAAKHILTLSLPSHDIFTLNRIAHPGRHPHFEIARLDSDPTDLEIVAETRGNLTLQRDRIAFAGGQQVKEWDSHLSLTLQEKIARISLHPSDGNQSGPASVFMMDETSHRHPVGLIVPDQRGDDVNTPIFYLRHALSLVSEMREGRLDDLLAQKLSVMIWPSQSALSVEDQRKLRDFVSRGGWLVRFIDTAGTTSEESGKPRPADPLLPVHLVGNLRDLGSIMSWEKPQTITAFSSSSPFIGLVAPTDLNIRKTILAQPDPDLPERIWARLTDGTPLITAKKVGRGEVVLFHADSGPDWGNLPLTGLFPDMLDRIIRRSDGVETQTTSDNLPPFLVLGDDGQWHRPLDIVKPLSAQMMTTMPPGPTHPPGLYGVEGAAHAYNLGPFLNPLERETSVGKRVTAGGVAAAYDASSSLLLLGMFLLSADFVLRARHLGLIAIGAILLCRFYTPYALAEGREISVDEAARTTRLAYVYSGQDALDRISRQGMKGISDYASDRTSARLAAPDRVMPGKDDLAPYPLIYWPVTPQTHYDAKRNAALDTFIKNGGMLLIDMVDAEEDESDASDTQRHLAQVTRGIHLPALTKLDDRHILAHCFYILRSFPGRFEGKDVWVARNADPKNDSVSPVIIGQADWARAWAVDDQGNHPYAVIPGDDRQRTLAERFGVNVIIYALTGNYKQDQMKVPALLKRLQP